MADKIKIGGELDPRTPEKILGDASTIKDRTWEVNHPDAVDVNNYKQDEINEYLNKKIDNLEVESHGDIQTDDAPEAGSVKLVRSGGTYTAIQNAATTAKTFSTGETVPNIGITPTLTNDTNKLVTSKGVKEAIENVAFSTNERIKDVGIDNEPTAGSENLVKSGGVYKIKELLNAQFPDYPSLQEITGWQDGKRIKKQDPVDINNPNSSSVYRTLVQSCVPGDCFVINGITSSYAYPTWFFIDAENHPLSSYASELQSINELAIAPENAVYLVLNDTGKNTNCYKGKPYYKIQDERITKNERNILSNTNKIEENTESINSIKSQFCSKSQTIEHSFEDSTEQFTFNETMFPNIGERFIIKIDVEDALDITSLYRCTSNGELYQELDSNIVIEAGKSYIKEFVSTRNTNSYLMIEGAANKSFSITLFLNYDEDTITTLKEDIETNGENIEDNKEKININIEDINNIETIVCYKTKETSEHTSEDSSEKIAFVSSIFPTVGQKFIVRIDATEALTITSLYRCKNDGSMYQQLDSNIQLLAGEIYIKEFTGETTSENRYLMIEGGANKAFVVTVYKNKGNNIEDIQNAITEIDKEIEELRNDTIRVPDYYVSQLETKVPIIQTNMNAVGRNGESFIYITDTHWDNNFRNSPVLVSYILEHTNVNIIICGGDVINDREKQVAINLWEDFLHKFNFKNIPIFYVYGNHDGNYNVPSTIGNPPTQDIANKLDFNAIFALSQKQSSMMQTFITDDDCTYYVDRPDTKTRFIMLDGGNTGNFTDYMDANTRPMHYTGLKAFCTLLVNTPSGYHVVVLPHAMKGHAYNLTELWDSTYIIGNIVDAFNAKTTYTLDSTTYDFSNANGEIVCVMAGHEHKDRDNHTANNFPVIITDTDSKGTHTEGGATEGTITEQAFDVVTIDYINKTIKCVRIGRGSDRTFNY